MLTPVEVLEFSNLTPTRGILYLKLLCRLHFFQYIIPGWFGDAVVFVGLIIAKFFPRFSANHIHLNSYHTSTTVEQCVLKTSPIIPIWKGFSAIYLLEKVNKRRLYLLNLGFVHVMSECYKLMIFSLEKLFAIYYFCLFLIATTASLRFYDCCTLDDV